jgi:hypothetical protein
MTPQRPNSSHDLTRTALAVLFIGALLSPRSESCFRFIRPLMGRYDCHHDLAAVSQTSDQIVGKAGIGYHCDDGRAPARADGSACHLGWSADRKHGRVVASVNSLKTLAVPPPPG